MKFKIRKDIFLENLNYVAKGISSKNLIPVLNGIKMELNDEGLILIGSDNDVTIKTFIKKEKIESVESNGKIVILGKYIVDIIRKLPNEDINVEVVDGMKILISTTNSEFNLNGIDANEYPNISLEENKNPIIINQEIFKNIINQTSFAISNQETRPLLTGINFKINTNKLECTATDSYRLAKKKIDIEDENEIDIVVPGKNLLELIKILNNDKDKIEIHIFNNKILFKFSNILFQSRLLNGTYPNTEKLIPIDFINNIKCNKHEFYTIIDRASLLTSEKEKNIVKLECFNNELIIKSNSPEIGKVEEKMIVETNNNENIKISFSAKYMMEALKAFKGEYIFLEYNGEVKPIILKDDSKENLIQLILPIRTY